MFSPLEQFEITPVLFLFKVFEFFGVTISNFSFFSIILFTLLIVFLFFGSFNAKLVPTFRQFVLEEMYSFIFSLLTANLGKLGQKFFPFIFCLFLFILTFNIFGLFPHSFTLASQIVVTCSLSFLTFFAVVFIGIKKHGLNLFGLFFPSEAPVWLAFLLVPIELVSFLSRPFSLAIRLFANMTAGHVLLKILAGFIIVFLSYLFGLLLEGFLFASFFDSIKSINFSVFSTDYISYNEHNNIIWLISELEKFYSKFLLSTSFISMIHDDFVAFRVATEHEVNNYDLFYLILLSYGHFSTDFLLQVLSRLSVAGYNSLFKPDLTLQYSVSYLVSELMLGKMDITSLVNLGLSTAAETNNDDIADKIMDLIFLARDNLNIVVVPDKSFLICPGNVINDTLKFQGVLALKELVNLLKIEYVLFFLYGEDSLLITTLLSDWYFFTDIWRASISNFSVTVVTDYFYSRLNASQITVDCCFLSVNLSILFIIGSIVVNMIVTFFSFILPIILLVFFIVLELFVAIVQAYVFSILTIIYLRDILFLH